MPYRTEDEARELWCPERAMVAATDGIYGEITEETHCIASKCARWEWGPMKSDVGNIGYCTKNGRPG